MWDFERRRTVYDVIVELKSLHNIMKFNMFETAKLTSGYLLGDILNRMLSVSENHGEKPTKMMMYSAHDNTLLSLTHLLKIANNRIIPYAACLIIELYEYESEDGEGGEFLIEILFRNQTFGSEIHRLKIPGCHIDDGTKFSGYCRLRNLVRISRYSTLFPIARRNKVCKIERKEI
uniref:acid phosphatase n=1 Tax=Romanomermis culicivorax TaxID=13658 RepID=A0A915JWP7_ROMCU